MQFERWVKVDIAQGRAGVLDCGIILYSDDIDPLKVGVELYCGQYEYPVDGTVSGRVITADGQTLTLTGYSEEDSNRAWVIIPQTALAHEGRIEAFVLISDERSSAVVLHARGYVRNTGGESNAV